MLSCLRRVLLSFTYILGLIIPVACWTREAPEGSSEQSSIVRSAVVEEIVALVGHAEEMPTQAFERLWIDPGPKQETSDAPGLLLIYPAPDATYSTSETQTRYAGRVEPEHANLTLNGQEVRVWPGGVFTGLIEIPAHDAPEAEKSFEFSARLPTGSTTIKRIVVRKPPPPKPAAWPPKIASINPKGDYWLRPDGELQLRMRASAGHKAYYRIGPKGSWKAMQASGESYRANLNATDFPSSEPTTVELKIEGTRDGKKVTDTETSSLKVRLLEAGKDVTGQVTKNLGTYLKNDEGWERYGNFWAGTKFPVVEKRGERILVEFGEENRNVSHGYVESEAVEIPEDSDIPAMVELDEPTITYAADRKSNEVTVTWQVASPVASVFELRPVASGQDLIVHLPGATSAKPTQQSPKTAHTIQNVRVEDAAGDQPPRVVVSLRGRDLWGYGWSRPAPDQLKLTVRSRPLIDITKLVPLEGFHVMLDAGHGGSDNGAVGPSGTLEKDTNLVLSALLEIGLETLGATVTQIRRDDAYIGLDDRVDMALAADPDLFISVHHNSVAMSTDPMADVGPKVYYHYDHSAKAAQVMATKLTELLRPEQEPRWHQQNFRVNRNISGCPSVLLEGGFLCNPLDEIELRKTDVLQDMADVLIEGIVELLGPNRSEPIGN